MNEALPGKGLSFEALGYKICQAPSGDVVEFYKELLSYSSLKLS